MNTESDTPRTDACWGDESCNILLHARQLEQELNALTSERNNLNASLTAAISSSNARHFESMEHEAKSKQLERELNEVTKQRDKLKSGLLTAAERGIRSNCYDTTVANQLYAWIMDDMRKDAPTELNYYLTQTK